MRAEKMVEFGGFDPEAIRKDYASWVEMLKKRKDLLVDEKKKQIKNQSLRETFLKAATVLDDFILSQKKAMSPEALRGKDLDAQFTDLEQIKTAINGNGRNEGERLYANLKSADDAMNKAGIDADGVSLSGGTVSVSPPSSPMGSPMALPRGERKESLRVFSFLALQVEFDSLKEAIVDRLNFLDKERAKQLKQENADEVNELRELFESCDKGKKGYLKKDEFIKCLTMLGEYVDPSEEDKLIQRIDQSGEGNVNLGDFTKYFLSLKKEGQTEEEMIASFVAMGADKLVTRQQMSAAMSADTVEFLCKVMPAKGQGYDFIAYCKQVFGKKQ